MLDFFTNIIAAVFSIIGLSIILIQLRFDARQFADQKPNTIHNWIMSFPIGRSITLSVQTGEHVHSADSVHKLVSLPANTTLENRVEFLFKHVNKIQDEIANVSNRIDNVTDSLTEKTRELKTNLENINKSLNTTIAGTLSVLMM